MNRLKDLEKIAIERFKAFERMIEHRKERNLETKWQNGEEVMK